jgi:N-carbamoylputrescine amidase
VRIAGVQLRCRVGRREDNLARAQTLAARAAAEGARLVLLPELAASGYTISPTLWDAVEPAAGPTVAWLRRTAERLQVYLGTSFAEFDAGHVYNTFVLAGPDGREAGRVRKSHAETYFFRNQWGPHVIDSALGRIGVGICADNQYADFARLMRRARVDLLLQPHAWPAARAAAGAASEADVRRQHQMARGLAPLYARLLGAPALFVNQCGPTVGRRGTGIFGAVMDSSGFYFPGLSTIADSDGEVLARLGGDEDVLCAEVTIDPARRPHSEPRLGRRWVTAGASRWRGLLVAVDGTLGKAYYAVNRHRIRPPGTPGAAGVGLGQQAGAAGGGT